MIEKMRRLMEDAMFTYHNSEEEISVKPFFFAVLAYIEVASREDHVKDYFKLNIRKMMAHTGIQIIEEALLAVVYLASHNYIKIKMSHKDFIICVEK